METHPAIATDLIAVDPDHPDPRVLAQAVAILHRGGLVAFPTETVYGLGADALDARAVARIFQAKGRPAHDPLIVHVADHTWLPRVVSAVPPLAEVLVNAFWPGPLTLVLPKAARVPDAVTAGGATVAVRCPQHLLALALIRAAGTPIAAPSANRFSHTSPTTAQHVWDDLAGRIELILDGGPAPIGVESTVLDVTGEVPVILRPGGLTLEALQAVAGEVETVDRRAAAGQPLASPGLLDRHYAPRAELWLFTGAEDDVRRAMLACAQGELRQGGRPGLLLADDDVPFLAGAGLPVASVGLADDLAQVAQRLFAALRSLDQGDVTLILARDFAGPGLGAAVRDRLRRAAHRIIDAGA